MFYCYNVNTLLNVLFIFVLKLRIAMKHTGNQHIRSMFVTTYDQRENKNIIQNTTHNFVCLPIVFCTDYYTISI